MFPYNLAEKFAKHIFLHYFCMVKTNNDESNTFLHCDSCNDVFLTKNCM